MAITKVYSVWVIGGAAVFALILSFFQKFGALIQTIPGPVMGGISMLLYGLIASSGLRTIVESGVDYQDKRNLTNGKSNLSLPPHRSTCKGDF